MPASLKSLSVFLQTIICHIISCVIVKHVYVWLRYILAKAMSEVLDRAHQFAVNWAARCVLFSFFSFFVSNLL
jgi:hypothetical protein